MFNANYLAYNDVAAIELWRAALGGYDGLPEAHGVDVLVAETTVRYLRPLTFDDEVEIEVGVRSLGTTSMNLGTRIRRSDELVTEIDTRSVFIEPESKTKTAIPEAVRALLVEFEIDW